MHRFHTARTFMGVALGVCSLAICGAATSAFAGGGRPNVIVMVADDLGWADVGFHGSPIATPSIDRIAESVAWLACDASAGCTGIDLPVDGGATAGDWIAGFNTL